MNIVCGIIAIALSTFVGYYLSSKWTDKKEFYSDFLAFHSNALKEIEFSKKTLIEISSKFSEEKDFGKVLKSKLTTPNELNFKPKYLTEDEIKYLEDYFSALGKGDERSEANFLKGETEAISNKASEATLNEKKYKKLYLKIGFLLGLMIFIVLI